VMALAGLFALVLYQLRLITSATEPRLRSKRATAGALADAG
jgi:hypothetical protein